MAKGKGESPITIHNNQAYKDWYELIVEAKIIGLTVEEVREFLGIAITDD
ncbi:anti-repressor SinI family protein [Heyndrickxia sporothermodurans]